MSFHVSTESSSKFINLVRKHVFSFLLIPMAFVSRYTCEMLIIVDGLIA